VSACIFDWGGTLTPWHTVEPLEAWIAAVGDPKLGAHLHAGELRAWARSQAEHRSATLDEVFREGGVEHTDEMLAAFYAWWEPHTFLDPDVPELFSGLRERGIKVGVLSNTLWPRAEHERIFIRDGILDLIDGAVYSSEIAWTKPHAEAFRAALDAVGVDDPTTAVFVGDRPFEDIHGAQTMGMRAILVPHSEIPDEQLGSVQGSPDAIAHRLADVLSIVDGWC